jgi:hypothetical protein
VVVGYPCRSDLLEWLCVLFGYLSALKVTSSILARLNLLSASEFDAFEAFCKAVVNAAAAEAAELASLGDVRLFVVLSSCFPNHDGKYSAGCCSLRRFPMNSWIRCCVR